MNIAIYGRPVNPKQVELAERVIQLLLKAGDQITIHEPYRHFLSKHMKLDATAKSFRVHEELRGKTDFLLSIGGDGTLLDTVLLVKDSGIPIAGINAGRLGFLSSISEDNLNLALESLAKGHYSLDARTIAPT